jgi:ATP-dependent Clp protease protease subunit
MKLSKVLLSLLVVLIVVFMPRLSVSKDSSQETIVLSNDNTLVLNSEVNGESVSAIIAKAKELDNKLNSGLRIHRNAPLYLFLNTPGGSVQSGLELIEALQGIGRPVHTITLFAASMGFQIAENLNDRLILKNGVLMSHHAAGEFAGQFGGIHPSQLDNRYQLWLDRVEELDRQTAKRTNGKKTYEEYIKQYDSEMWLTGTKSVAQGYADRIVHVKCDSSLSGTTTSHINFLGLDVSFELDRCPINTGPMKAQINLKPTQTITPEMEAKVKAEFLDSFNNKQKLIAP